MRATRFARRRRAGRDEVALAFAPPQPGISDEVGQAWQVALHAAELLRDHFPAFYAEHVAPHRATLPAGLGACCAFWRLVELENGLDLRWPEGGMGGWGTELDDDLDEDALADPALLMRAYFTEVSEEWLSSLYYWLTQPRPCYHGWDAQSRLSGDYEQAGLLTGLLWHLLSATELSVGDADVIQQALSFWSEEDRFDILRIPPLRADIGARELLALVAADIPEARELSEPSMLLRYALGCTGNPLADTGPADLHAVHMHDDVEFWRWDQAAELGRQQQEARLLESAFIAWRDRIEAGGIHALRGVARLFHRAAQRLERDEATRDRSLAALFGGGAFEASEEDEMEISAL